MTVGNIKSLTRNGFEESSTGEVSINLNEKKVNNKLDHIPESVLELPSLEELWVEGNKLKFSPKKLRSNPNLKIFK